MNKIVVVNDICTDDAMTLYTGAHPTQRCPGSPHTGSHTTEKNAKSTSTVYVYICLNLCSSLVCHSGFCYRQW